MSNEEDLRACCFTRVKDRRANSTGRRNTLIEVFMGQRANGARVPQLENGVDTDHG
jgi:hypothetical protein